MNDLIDTYGRKARLYPAILCLPPFFLIKHLIVDPLVESGLYRTVFGVAIGDISLGVVLLYTLMQMSRFISKSLLEEKSRFSTDRMLSPSRSEMSAQFREQIAAKVLSDFRLILPSVTDERENPIECSTRIREIVSLIVSRVGTGKLLLQHNIEYGFVRNLVGGSVVALLASITAAVLLSCMGNSASGYHIGIFLVVVYTVPILLSRIVLRSYSDEYARILFREYVGGV